MKTLYLDCSMGAAGDMLAAALLELVSDSDDAVTRLNGLGIPGVTFRREASEKCGIVGTHLSVSVNGEEEHAGMHQHHDHQHHDHDHHHEHAHEHHHSSLGDVEEIIASLDVPERVASDAVAVYALIAEAESHAHGMPVSDIHFHEVGTADAIADVVSVCLLMNELAPDEVVVSPVHVGSGSVVCAHGTLPVPAPATAYILKDVPLYGGAIEGELCTPTGAALLRHFATRFGPLPVMRIQSIGYGMGAKDFPQANCVRAMLGVSEADSIDAGVDAHWGTDEVVELSCNIDDMTAEAIAFSTERLFECGALEVCTVPIGMKKGRPGTLICALCDERDKKALVEAFFTYTTTLGVREKPLRRYVLEREVETVRTPYGNVRCKTSAGYGVSRTKCEFDDVSRIAREKKIGLDEARLLIEAYLEKGL